MTDRPAPGTLADYRQHVAITTRWSDNDAYGHINNVAYYSFFDTAVNMWLIRSGVLDIQKSPVIGLVVETGCRYFRPLAYPVEITAGIRVARIGTSSVRYEVGIFGGEDATAAAEGHFIHVYVSRDTGRPVPLPADLRAALETILVL
ncbi:acyl-CoA thioesterase [Neoroseomonas soli]|uniref:Acyl-CoA thioesterase n=1 Tax=Neoroseomonas soli TaxID=1081025 RepID=A0A9X9WWW9_9PROT|nr:thioesterase family protein [Neoroseomonas soli]MBR0671648.1 acyl-CoA thioesterase [Neoroseomonas soli]